MRIPGIAMVGIVGMIAVVTATAENPPQAGKTPGGLAADPKPIKKSDADDLAAIRNASEDFVKAFNVGDVKAVSAHWAEDSEYVDVTGRIFSGRDAIEKEYAAFFKAKKGLKMTISIDALRLLSRTTAIEDGRASLGPASAGSMTKYTAVHIKVGDKWLMSTVRDSAVEAAPPRELDDLDWLIGTWVAEENGARTESVCRWVADKSFVERIYSIEHPDKTTSSGVQIIGFNPQGNHVQSWNFSSDGGFATGIWTREENGWSAEVSGTTGNGTSITALNSLTRLDDNAYSWQSVSRTVGGASLTDTDEVVYKRTKKSK